MDEDRADEELKETIAEVADAWQLFPEPGVLTTGGLERAEEEPPGTGFARGRRRFPDGGTGRP